MTTMMKRTALLAGLAVAASTMAAVLLSSPGLAQNFQGFGVSSSTLDAAQAETESKPVKLRAHERSGRPNSAPGEAGRSK